MDLRPACLVTGAVSPYRQEPFRLLSAAEDVEVLAWEDAGAPVPGLPVRRTSQAGAVRLVASGRYRAVISSLNGRIALPGCYLGARARRIPFVLWAWAWEHPSTAVHALSRLPTRHLYRHADAVATYGVHVSRYVERLRGARGGVHVAPQAVDIAHYGAPVPEESRRRAREQAIGGDGAGPLFVYVGRLEREKGVPVLLEAWRSADLDQDARLALAGTGSLADEVARAGHGVRALGYVASSELPALYAAADVLVLPSVRTATFTEPWGLVVNEAMLQSVPVIASDAVGAAAGGLVRDGRNGLVFPAGSAEALAARLRLLAVAPELRERLGTAAREDAAVLTPADWARGMGLALAAAGGSRGN